MNSKIKYAILIALLILFYGFFALIPSSVKTKRLNSVDALDYNLTLDDSESNSTEPKFPYNKNGFLEFKEAIGFKESAGKYNRVNKYGYLGKYQFGKETLKLIGIYNTITFLNTPELQEQAFLVNAKRNKWILRRDIKRFVGKKISGVIITESGILASAHLAGPGNVKRFLRSYGTINTSDAFGSSILKYMKLFSGYDTSVVEAERNPKVSF